MGLVMISDADTDVPEPIARLVPAYAPAPLSTPLVNDGQYMTLHRFRETGPSSRPPMPLAPACRDHGSGINVTVIDQSDRAGTTLARAYAGALPMARSVRDVASQIAAAAACRRIQRLLLADHGTEHNLTIGDEYLSLHNAAGWTRELSRLRGCFAPDGYVVLISCQVGMNEALMRMLVDAFGVPVCAATAMMVAGFGGRILPWGRWVWYDPNGSTRVVSRSEILD